MIWREDGKEEMMQSYYNLNKFKVWQGMEHKCRIFLSVFLILVSVAIFTTNVNHSQNTLLKKTPGNKKGTSLQWEHKNNKEAK